MRQLLRAGKQIAGGQRFVGARTRRRHAAKGKRTMAKLFRRILCPVDFNDSSMEALEVAATLALENDAVLYLMHVIFVPLTSPGLPLEPYAPVSSAPTRLQLEKIASDRLGNNLGHEIVVKIGQPADEINKAAEDLDVDLIVMATHGRTGVARLFLGSVAERVVRGCKRAVLTTRPKTAATSAAA
jgi:universal stress protein A